MSGIPDDLLSRYEGLVVPRSFSPGFIALSYLVSFIGAACTLELLNRRTSHKGKFNHLLLVTSAVSMGGIAIWCMHFIGNRAIHIANGERQLQIAYSSSFTAVSFFVPIVVLLGAFLAIGINNIVSWWRVTAGGVLAGAAICGMHYLGEYSVSNYDCIYRLSNVLGSAIIAVAASIVSLALFFVFRATWTNTWWKRGACSVVLAGAVSGMHWCAATGTEYRLKSLNRETGLSRDITVIVVICLSVCACSVMAGVAIYTARVMRRYASKAQQVVLAAAVFDQHGRILVNPEGLLPTEKITDMFVERDATDTFSTAHPLFLWMFRVTRDWTSVSPFVGGMASHLASLPTTGRDRDSNLEVQLIDKEGEVIPQYDTVLRELFCLAAVGLADKLKEQLSSVGVLWDEILPTGGGARGPEANASEADDHAEKGLQQRRKQNEVGRGSLMFLVRQLDNERVIQRLEAAGYRFAELRQVSGIIGSGMQIKSGDVESKLRNMAAYAKGPRYLEPGVHLGLFGIQARVGRYGFDVLVRKGARNLLPSVRLPLRRVEQWQKDSLKQLDGTSVSMLSLRSEETKAATNREATFILQLLDGLNEMRGLIDDPVFNDALLVSSVVTVPTPIQGSESSRQLPSYMIVFRLVVPIHVKFEDSRCEFVPLSFFKTCQFVGNSTNHQLAFAQSVHRDFSPILQSTWSGKGKPGAQKKGREAVLFRRVVPTRLRRSERSRLSYPVDGDGNPIPTTRRESSASNSHDTGSTLKLWTNRRGSEPHSVGSSFDTPPGYTQNETATMVTNRGGIMVSEEIRVEVQDAQEDTTSPPPSASGSGELTRTLTRKESRDDDEGTGGEITHVDSGSVAAPGSHGGADGGAAIEMNQLSPTIGTMRDKVHTGVVTQVSNVQALGVSDAEAKTFVDELFAACIDRR
ncbi:hypothetical protein SODALDRAFT_284565 [Sodiomyces alkalinus F11]|uniref:MHYT domain-containing protein n=1 Tax=Sodiomyces alkalinus (strain CBS 110278 / VKM F-3762 / F11) TaxID=1314773 RepID=A0A3N2PKD3_SODAK|nr:hypothetical protein SODALDRAFT_284565 [Sodiomyces alkalinus F11]ROT34959.1 hypothetical protein SODALDRAFT_284565 [Sodiomyces alkalinus F11]